MMRDALCLTCCARCSAHLAAEPQAVPAEMFPVVFCGPCRAIVEAEERARPCMPNRPCVHVDYQHGPFATLVVSDVHGDQVTVFALGFPGQPVPFGPLAGRSVFARGELLMTPVGGM